MMQDARYRIKKPLALNLKLHRGSCIMQLALDDLQGYQDEEDESDNYSDQRTILCNPRYQKKFCSDIFAFEEFCEGIIRHFFVLPFLLKLPLSF